MKTFLNFLKEFYLIPFLLFAVGIGVSVTMVYFGASAEDISNVFTLIPMGMVLSLIYAVNITYLRKRSMLRGASIPFWVHLRVFGQLGIIGSVIFFFYLLLKYDVVSIEVLDYKVHDLFTSKYLFIFGTFLMISSEVLRYLELIAHVEKNESKENKA
jgi:hypothetical protein